MLPPQSVEDFLAMRDEPRHCYVDWFARLADAVAFGAHRIIMQLVLDVAENEKFAARVFRAYSAKARLRVIAQLLRAPEVEVS